jgi:hypothetical protein
MQNSRYARCAKVLCLVNILCLRPQQFPCLRHRFHQSDILYFQECQPHASSTFYSRFRLESCTWLRRGISWSTEPAYLLLHRCRYECTRVVFVCSWQETSPSPLGPLRRPLFLADHPEEEPQIPLFAPFKSRIRIRGQCQCLSAAQLLM